MSLNSKAVFLIIGGPGSGKSTIAAELSGPNVLHQSLGGIYRELSKEKSTQGREIKRLIDHGQVVPPRIAKRALTSSLINDFQVVLIDGFPRTLNQALMFDAIVSRTKYQLNAVVELLVDPEIAFQRIVGRNRGVDDNPDMFESRMQLYLHDIHEIRHYYQNKNSYKIINGNPEKSVVVSSLREIIHST